MSSAEFAEWAAYHQVEPFGAERLDFGFGLVCATIVNLFRDAKAKPATPADFMPLTDLADGAGPPRPAAAAELRRASQLDFIAELKRRTAALPPKA